MPENIDNDSDLESRLAEALQIAENDKQDAEKEEEKLDDEKVQDSIEKETEELLNCPKCGKSIDFFYEKTYGWVQCPECSKSVRVSDFKRFGIPNDVPLQSMKEPETQKPIKKEDVEMDKKKKRMMLEMMDEEDDDDDYYYDDDDDDNSYSRTPIFKDEKREHWIVLKNILMDYECSRKFVDLMVKKAKRFSVKGPMHPEELYNYIMTFKSGIKSPKGAKMISNEYAEALDIMFDEKSKRSEEEGYSYRGGRRPSPPGREDYDPTYRKRTYSYEPAEKRKDSDSLSVRDITQIIKEEFHHRDKRDKVDDLADYVKDLQKMILEKDRDKDSDKFDKIQEQMMQMQDNFQEALLELASNKETDKQSELEFKKWQVEMEQKRESDRLQMEQRRESDRQNRESQDRILQMMTQQQQNQNLKLREKESADSLREQQMLGMVMDTVSRERKDSEKQLRELAEAKKHGDYQNDNIRLTADAMDKLARIAESRKPVDALMHGLVKLARPTPLPTQQSQLPPPKAVEKKKVLEIDETDEILSAFGDEDIVD